MARPIRPVLNWDELNPGQPIVFYTANGWKKATIHQIHHNSCSVSYTHGAHTETIKVYDHRNLGHAERAPARCRDPYCESFFD